VLELKAKLFDVMQNSTGIYHNEDNASEVKRKYEMKVNDLKWCIQQLESIEREKNQEILVLQANLDEYCKTLLTMEDRITTLTRKNVALKSQADAARARANHQKDECERHKTLARQVETSNQQLREQIAELHRVLESKEQTHRQQLAGIQKQLQLRDGLADEYREEIQQLNNQLKEAHKKCGEYEVQRKEHSCHIEALGSELRDTNNNALQTQQELERSRQEALQLITQLQATQSKLSEVTTTLSAERTEHTQALRLAQEHDAAHSTQIAKLQADMEVLAAEKSQVATAYQRECQQTRELRDMLDTANANVAAERYRADDLAETLAQLQARTDGKLQKTADEHAVLAMSLNASDQNLQQLCSDNQHLETRNRELTTTLRQVNSALSASKAEVDQARAAATLLQKEVTAACKGKEVLRRRLEHVRHRATLLETEFLDCATALYSVSTDSAVPSATVVEEINRARSVQAPLLLAALQDLHVHDAELRTRLLQHIALPTHNTHHSSSSSSRASATGGNSGSNSGTRGLQGSVSAGGDSAGDGCKRGRDDDTWGNAAKRERST
jgi:chromosome segregation ATPase